MKSNALKVHKAVEIMLLILIIFALFFINSCATISHNYNFINKYKFNFKQSIPIFTRVNLPTNYLLKDINGRSLSLQKGKTVLIFGSRECGSCLDLDPSVPYLVNKYPSITWIYVEKSNLKPVSVLYEIKNSNFHIVQENAGVLASIFKSAYTPDIFFVEKDEVVYEKLGFMDSDFGDIVSALDAFVENNSEYLKSHTRKLLIKGEKFPTVVVRTFGNKKIIIPKDFVGRPTAIFIFHGTCGRCKEVMEYMPSKFKKEEEINKAIIFTPFSAKLNKMALEYAKQFHLTELYYELKSPPLSTFYNINTVYSMMHNASNTIYINDEMLQFQNSIGFVSSPVIIILNKEGEFDSIFEPPADKTLTPKFFNDLTKYLLNLQ